MMSCAARDAVRAQTLERLASTDWGSAPVVLLDASTAERPQQRQEDTARRLLELAAAAGDEFVLFLEDDLDFNAHLRHNLEHWQPLLDAEPDSHLMASLYDPGVAAVHWDLEHAFSIAHPELVYGSQAFVLARRNGRGRPCRLVDGSGHAGHQDLPDRRVARADPLPPALARPARRLSQHVGRQPALRARLLGRLARPCAQRSVTRTNTRRFARYQDAIRASPAKRRCSTAVEA